MKSPCKEYVTMTFRKQYFKIICKDDEEWDEHLDDSNSSNNSNSEEKKEKEIPIQKDFIPIKDEDE